MKWRGRCQKISKLKTPHHPRRWLYLPIWSYRSTSTPPLRNNRNNNFADYRYVLYVLMLLCSYTLPAWAIIVHIILLLTRWKHNHHSFHFASKQIKKSNLSWYHFVPVFLPACWLLARHLQWSQLLPHLHSLNVVQQCVRQSIWACLEVLALYLISKWVT